MWLGSARAACRVSAAADGVNHCIGARARDGESAGQNRAESVRVRGGVGRHEYAGGWIAAAGALGVSSALVVALVLGAVELVEYCASLGRVVKRRVLLRTGRLQSAVGEGSLAGEVGFGDESLKRSGTKDGAVLRELWGGRNAGSGRAIRGVFKDDGGPRGRAPSVRPRVRCQLFAPGVGWRGGALGRAWDRFDREASRQGCRSP